MRLGLLVASCLLGFSAVAEDAPLSLTASDGTGLKLVSYGAKAVVEDPLTFTELTLVFENPQDRVIEGQFRVTLPRGATVSRFAMKLDGRWQEGEVLEKQAARRAYEDFLHRRQDPALLEQAAGNEFSARVFPIPARGRKELIVSWSHALTSATAPFVLPLKGLPKIDKLEVSVSSGGAVLQVISKTGYVPDKDLAVAPPRADRTGLRAGDLVVTRIKAVATSTPEPMPSLLLLVDTSASRALGFSAQITLVQRLVERLAKANPAMPLTVAAFDQSVVAVHEGPASGFGAAAVKALKDRKALGASNLSAALQWALAKKAARVVVVTDGVFTSGDVEGDQLLAAVARLKDAGVQRLDAIAVGGIREEAVLRRLVAFKLPKAGTVLDGDLDVDSLVRRLGESTVAKVPITAEGAKVVWPLALEGVQAGDEAVVVLEAAGEAKVIVKAGAVSVNLGNGLAGVERPLLQRAWAQAKILALLDQQDRAADGAAQKQKLRDEIIALSVRHRVLSPYTALLVLETEADYARFKIDRRALADILTVEKNRLALLPRAPDAIVLTKVPPKVTPMMQPKASAAKDEAPSRGMAPPPVSSEPPKAAEADSEDDFDQAFGSAEPEKKSMPPRSTTAFAPAPAPPPPPQLERMERRRSAVAEEEAMPTSREPWEGPFKEVMVALAAKQTQKALDRALGWREEQAGDVLALIALGEALEAKGDLNHAARAYGSIIDLFPGRADLRRFAGVRLERLKGDIGLALAADTFAKAAEQRPDHPASHRFLAFALLRLGKPDQAFAALEKGIAQPNIENRFLGSDRILREDLGLVGAAWIKKDPGVAANVRERLKKVGATLEDKPSVRFVLTWETDANDVDFHITDGKGGHAFYSQRTLPSGGELYADVTTGYGPEEFTIRLAPEQRAYPYKLRAHYYSRGPMGYGMGKLQIVEHDGKGGFQFEDRPFVVMVDGAFVDLGEVKK